MITVSALRCGGGGGGGAMVGLDKDFIIALGVVGVVGLGVVGEVTTEVEGLEPDDDWRRNSNSCCVAFLV